jgi:hypothetical protein
MVVEENIESARFNMNPDMSMTSSVMNMQMNLMSPHMSNQNFGMNMAQQQNDSSVYFEEVKSQSVNSRAATTNEQGTDVRNLVNFNNFGCGTSVQTVEK